MYRKKEKKKEEVADNTSENMALRAGGFQGNLCFDRME